MHCLIFIFVLFKLFFITSTGLDDTWYVQLMIVYQSAIIRNGSGLIATSAQSVQLIKSFNYIVINPLGNNFYGFLATMNPFRELPTCVSIYLLSLAVAGVHMWR